MSKVGAQARLSQAYLLSSPGIGNPAGCNELDSWDMDFLTTEVCSRSMYLFSGKKLCAMDKFRSPSAWYSFLLPSVPIVQFHKSGTMNATLSRAEKRVVIAIVLLSA
ncbi:MAG: hypothetical protein A4E47_00317 [Methanosaeta sp. PtaU1.Bin028]|nr:MAG: hypothetical protein A4E47_00317 [Methanosaeta sp. PtaU1.Bin028]